MRKSGYENAARAVPGRGADFCFFSRRETFVIGAERNLVGVGMAQAVGVHL